VVTPAKAQPEKYHGVVRELYLARVFSNVFRCCFFIERNYYSHFGNSRQFLVTPFPEKVLGICHILSKLIYKFQNKLSLTENQKDKDAK